MTFFGVPLLAVFWILFGGMLGFFGHLLLKIGEIRQTTDPAMTLKKYLLQGPYMTGSKLIAVSAACMTLATTNATIVTFLSAIAIGYAADSAGNHLKRF